MLPVLPIALVLHAALPSQVARLAPLTDLASREPQGVVLAFGEGAPVYALMALPHEEPLLELDLTPRALDWTDTAAKALAEREGWVPGGFRWAWMAPDGRIKATGTQVPTGEALRKGLLAAGWELEDDRLGRHLQAYPAVVDAWNARLACRLRLARRRMAQLPADTGPAKPLDAATDQRIWAPVEEALAQVLSLDAWALRATGPAPEPTSLLLPEEATRSPRMAALCRQHLGRLEGVLRRHPLPHLLHGWLSLARVAGETAPWEALARLEASPAAAPVLTALDPGESATLLAACQSHAQARVLTEAWMPDFTALEDLRLEGSARQAAWEALKGRFPFLLQGLLFQERFREVTDLVTRLANLGCSEVPSLAAGITRTAGQADLAATLETVPVRKVIQDPSPLGRLLGEGRGPVLLILEPEPRRPTLASLFAQTHDALSDLGLSLVMKTGEDARAALALVERPPAPRWLLMDGHGTVLKEGLEAPDPRILAKVLETTGHLPLRAALDTFIEGHPDHLPAQWDRFILAQDQAWQAMRPLVQEMPRSQETPGILWRPLREEEDARIWGPAAQRLTALWQSPQWQLGSGPLALPAFAQHSSRMRKAAAVALEALREALIQAPQSEPLWRLWVSYARVGTPPALVPFLDRLSPVPGRGPVPPPAILEILVASLRSQSQWAGLRDLLERERHQGWGKEVLPQSAKAFRPTWDHRVAPLLEAYLRLDQDAAADGLLLQVLARQGHRELPTLAAAQARTCGKDELARRWLAMEVDQ